MDLSQEKLQEYIVEPYHKGEEFFCGGVKIDPFDIEYIRISKTDKSFKELKPIVEKRAGFTYMVGAKFYVVDEGENVTREFIRHIPRKEVKKTDEAPKSLSNNIFIVHGRDDKPKLELARMLEKLGFNVIILSEQPDKGRTIIEKLEQETIDIGYAFVILTPDDVRMERGLFEKMRAEPEKYRDIGLCYRAHQNVTLELGYFVGKIGRNRVCCLYKRDVELPSDIHGVLFKKFNESVEECYKGILDELKAAGYEMKI